MTLILKNQSFLNNIYLVPISFYITILLKVVKTISIFIKLQFILKII